MQSSRSDGFGIGTEDTLKEKNGYMAPYYENRNFFGEKQARSLPIVFCSASSRTLHCADYVGSDIFSEKNRAPPRLACFPVWC